jgi:hypothetical protein
MQPAGTPLAANSWTAQWMGEARQFAPVLELGKRAVRLVSGGTKQPAKVEIGLAPEPGRGITHALAATAAVAASRIEPSRPDSAVASRATGADSLALTLERVDPDATVIRSSFSRTGP